MEVRKISNKDTYPFLLNIHYAHRIPSISYAFGLFDGCKLIGVCTYGTPPSANLKKGLAGDKYKDIVIELNRLCLLNNRKYEASILVSKSLRMLPHPKIVISYADTGQNHLGVVYQACSLLYCGLSAKRSDLVIKGMEHLHSITIMDKYRGVPNRCKRIKEDYGSRVYYKPRSRKHRYVKLLGSKKQRKEMLKALKYKIEDYPKGI